MDNFLNYVRIPMRARAIFHVFPDGPRGPHSLITMVI
jgi:hypothetical protein